MKNSDIQIFGNALAYEKHFIIHNSEIFGKIENHYYHYLCNLLGIITIKVKPEGHHFPVVRFQLALCYSVSHIRDLKKHLFM